MKHILSIAISVMLVACETDQIALAGKSTNAKGCTPSDSPCDTYKDDAASSTEEVNDLMTKIAQLVNEDGNFGAPREVTREIRCA